MSYELVYYEFLENRVKAGKYKLLSKRYEGISIHPHLCSTQELCSNYLDGEDFIQNNINLMPVTKLRRICIHSYQGIPVV